MFVKKDVGSEITVKPVSSANCIENIEGKFEIEDILQAFKQGLEKFLKKRKYTIADDSNTVIESELSKVDVGNRFLRYVSIGLAGKANVGVSGKVINSGNVLHEFDIEVPYTSASWIHTPKLICKGAAKGCALKVAKLFKK